MFVKETKLSQKTSIGSLDPIHHPTLFSVHCNHAWFYFHYSMEISYGNISSPSSIDIFQLLPNLTSRQQLHSMGLLGHFSFLKAIFSKFKEPTFIFFSLVNTCLWVVFLYLIIKSWCLGDYQGLRGEENGESVFPGYRISVQEYKNTLEMDGGDDITTL